MFKHGHSSRGAKGSTYQSWLGMRARCFNQNEPDYPRYGGRGISVCERWNVFLNFLKDMGPRPSPKHSIDRFPNQDGNYELGNCRWATKKEQARNRRSNRKLTFNGETLCLSEWVEKTGLSMATIWDRLNVRGYTVDETLSIPWGAKRNG